MRSGVARTAGDDPAGALFFVHEAGPPAFAKEQSPAAITSSGEGQEAIGRPEEFSELPSREGDGAVMTGDAVSSPFFTPSTDNMGAGSSSTRERESISGGARLVRVSTSSVISPADAGEMAYPKAERLRRKMSTFVNTSGDSSNANIIYTVGERTAADPYQEPSFTTALSNTLVKREQWTNWARTHRLDGSSNLCGGYFCAWPRPADVILDADVVSS